MEKYEIKDVVFGLRKEYLRIQKELDTIENMVILPEAKDKLSYSIVTDEEKKTLDLKIELLKRQSVILSIFQKLGKNIVGENEKRQAVSGNERGILIADSKKIILPKDPTSICKLTKAADMVLSSPLVKDGHRKAMYVESYLKDVYVRREINVSPLNMSVQSWEMKQGTPSIPSDFMTYLSEYDTLKYSSYHDLASSPSVERCLHSTFDGNNLTGIERKIIDGSNVMGKKLTVENNGYLVEETLYNIDETHDEIRLVRK